MRDLADIGYNGQAWDPLRHKQVAANFRRLMAPGVAEVSLGAATVRTWMLQFRTGAAADAHTMAALALQVKGRCGCGCAGSQPRCWPQISRGCVGGPPRAAGITRVLDTLCRGATDLWRLFSKLLRLLYDRTETELGATGETGGCWNWGWLAAQLRGRAWPPRDTCAVSRRSAHDLRTLHRMRVQSVLDCAYFTDCYDACVAGLQV